MTPDTDCKTLDLSVCHRCGEVLYLNEGVAVYIRNIPRLLCGECVKREDGLMLYQVEYCAYGLTGCPVEIERETLEEAIESAEKVCGYLCHEAKVRDMSTREIVYDTEDRGIE